MSKEMIHPYFAAGNEMTDMSWYRYIAPNIKKMRLGVGVSTSLFITPTGFPILGIKDAKDSFVLGEVFYLNDTALKSIAKMYRHEFPECQLHKITVREVDIFALSGFRGSDAVEKRVSTYGLLYSEAGYHVSQGRLRYSVHNSYHNEITNPSPANRKSYPHKTFVPANFKEVEDD